MIYDGTTPEAQANLGIDVLHFAYGLKPTTPNQTAEQVVAPLEQPVCLDWEENNSYMPIPKRMDPTKGDIPLLLETCRDGVKLADEARKTNSGVNLYYQLGIATSGNLQTIRKDDTYPRWHQDHIETFLDKAPDDRSDAFKFLQVCGVMGIVLYFTETEWPGDWEKYREGAYKVLERTCLLAEEYGKSPWVIVRPEGFKPRDWEDWLFGCDERADAVVVWEKETQKKKIWDITQDIARKSSR